MHIAQCTRYTTLLFPSLDIVFRCRTNNSKNNISVLLCKSNWQEEKWKMHNGQWTWTWTTTASTATCQRYRFQLSLLCYFVFFFFPFRFALFFFFIVCLCVGTCAFWLWVRPKSKTTEKTKFVNNKTASDNNTCSIVWRKTKNKHNHSAK